MSITHLKSYVRARCTTLLGLISSALVLAAFACVYHSYADSDANTLDDLSRLIVAASALITLVWLVIGYWQNGRTLQLTARTLELQQTALDQQRQTQKSQGTLLERLSDNMTKQATATKSLAQTTAKENQRIASRNAQEAAPRFVPNGVLAQNGGVQITIANTGADVHDNRIVHDGPHRFAPPVHPFIQSGGMLALTLTPNAGPVVYPVSFSIRSTDRFDQHHRTEFRLDQGNLQKVDYGPLKDRREG